MQVPHGNGSVPSLCAHSARVARGPAVASRYIRSHLFRNALSHNCHGVRKHRSKSEAGLGARKTRRASDQRHFIDPYFADGDKADFQFSRDPGAVPAAAFLVIGYSSTSNFL